MTTYKEAITGMNEEARHDIRAKSLRAYHKSAKPNKAIVNFIATGKALAKEEVTEVITAIQTIRTVTPSIRSKIHNALTVAAPNFEKWLTNRNAVILRQQIFDEVYDIHMNSLNGVETTKAELNKYRATHPKIWKEATNAVGEWLYNA